MCVFWIYFALLYRSIGWVGVPASKAGGMVDVSKSNILFCITE